MATFQAKIVWKMPGKRENKNFRFVPTDALQKIPKEQEKSYKNKKKYIMASFQAKIG